MIGWARHVRSLEAEALLRPLGTLLAVASAAYAWGYAQPLAAGLASLGALIALVFATRDAARTDRLRAATELLTISTSALACGPTGMALYPAAAFVAASRSFGAWSAPARVAILAPASAAAFLTAYSAWPAGATLPFAFAAGLLLAGASAPSPRLAGPSGGDEPANHENDRPPDAPPQSARVRTLRIAGCGPTAEAAFRVWGEGHGWSVETGAGDAAAAGHGPFDVILVDRRGLTEQEAAALRAAHGAARWIELRSREEASEAPADDVLVRPVDWGALAGRLDPDHEPSPVLVADGVDAGPDLADHPVVDHDVLKALERLAGASFVSDVIVQFASEAHGVISALARAIRTSDPLLFSHQVHALRSGAANVGARRIFQLCLAWRETTQQQLAREGAARVERLQSELEASLSQLTPYVIADPAAESPPQGEARPAA